MKKILVNIMCCFIPSADLRHKLRRANKPSVVKINGVGNKILIYSDGVEYVNSAYDKIPNLRITINGNNNVIKLHCPIVAKGSSIYINNDNAEIEIFPTDNMVGLFVFLPHGGGQKLKIGRNTTFWGCEINLANYSSCVIGEDCMFSTGINIRGGDNHSILDKETGEILNLPTGDLVIGNHCWVGLNAAITKNARVPNNTIIGTGAVVTKAFTEEYTALAGNPARVVRSGLAWDRRDIDKLQRAREAEFGNKKY